jgi:hypothetical protein
VIGFPLVSAVRDGEYHPVASEKPYNSCVPMLVPAAEFVISFTVLLIDKSLD